MIKRNACIAVLYLSLCVFSYAQRDITTFEMRYFTKDAKADGVTDFHGETEWFDTEGRVDVLKRYAEYASLFWGDPGLDKPLFTDDSVKKRREGIKPQPLTAVRNTIRLDDWKAYGYKKGKKEAVTSRWKVWTERGARISDGCLILEGTTATIAVKPLKWRFRMKASLRGKPSGLKVSLVANNGETIDFHLDPISEFEIYGDLSEGMLFLSSGGKTIQEKQVPEQSGVSYITSISLSALNGNALVDSISLYNFEDHREDNAETPYWTELIFDEDFNAIPSMDGWQTRDYDDSLWDLVTLPSPHGGFKEAGEDYYLRTSVHVGEFTGAFLKMETLDPGGEVWVNGEPAAVLSGRVPRVIDVSDFMIEGQDNTIAVKVKCFYPKETMGHTPNDHNIGWFLGRTELILQHSQSHIVETLVHTASIEGSDAVQHHKITLRNDSGRSWQGSIVVNYYPWFPADGPVVASMERVVELRPRVDNQISLDTSIPHPELWSTSNPSLYKVEVILKDKEGKPVDDYVSTTGIRFIEQREGVLYINGMPEMLKGAQIFGFRLPLETVAKTIRCATSETVMRELMMAKALGNLMRIHVHAELNTPDGINDPRFAEYADQLGLYLIWQTSGWVRQGDVWNVDFANYPTYIRQVFNHPSIIMWEASNHPDQFRNHDFNDTEDFINTIVPAIVRTDSCRLVSPISFWQRMHYANYDGTLDYKGGVHKPNQWLMHRMMTRGSQDSYTGYSNNWSNLRKSPSKFAKSCLEAKDLCYFNFEHEESIAQPNWELARKEPWYKVFSYEKRYEKGSIGRLLTTDEWRASQGFQAFAAWESMKKQTLDGVSGFSWCSLESGPNMFTYEKPLVDPFYVPKLAFYANRMVFGRIWAASGDVDTVYGPGDLIEPVIFNMDEACEVLLSIELQNEKGKTLERKVFKDVNVPKGRSVTRLEPFRFKNDSEGVRFVVYKLKQITPVSP